MTDLKLSHDLAFEDLYGNEGLKRIDRLFIERLEKADGELKDRLCEARKAPDGLEKGAESDLLLDLAPHMDGFVAGLFGVGAEAEDLSKDHEDLSVLYSAKRLFVQRRAAKTYGADEAAAFNGPALEAQITELLGRDFDQLSFSHAVMGWLEDEDEDAKAIETALKYAAWALWTEEGQARHKEDVLFRKPQRLDSEHLVPAQKIKVDGVEALGLPPSCLEPRDGFSLTDEGTGLVGALDESNYCLICHHRGRDTCSKGMFDRKTGAFSKSPFGVILSGCPLEEKISEMHEAKNAGHAIAALALITVDNPIVAGTGHRICNECMKACIYQKQDPVDIPEVETRTLKDVLFLPWGFEIYGLLTRWNPLDIRRPYPKDDSGSKVLIVGLGPAGFTLSHYLMNQGHTVVAVDGAKIEPLDPEISGVGPAGERVAFKPIHDIEEICEDLDDRVMAGFGGVAEYGITVRWNKNFLKLIRLLIERRDAFAMFGGVRFGSTINTEQAFEMGFDHIALCLGAGRPTYLPIPHGLAHGVRQASDFLMALQLTGAAKMSSLANLQIRMPVVVVGGGLTAIDTATEALAYYVRQVEKFLHRYEILVAENGEDAVRAPWSETERDIADEFIAHAHAIRAERETAASQKRKPDFIELLNSWGGSTVAYRRRLIDAPSYTLNHEEITKAFEEGIRFAELLSPVGVEVDEHGHAKGLRLARQAIGEDGRPKPTGRETVLPARAILIAAGTKPNTVLAREHPEFAALDGKYFQALDEEGETVSPEEIAKPDDVQVLMKCGTKGCSMSFFGDLHPSYAGNVVKAMASAKQGYPVIDRTLVRTTPSPVPGRDLIGKLNDGLHARVERVERLTPNIVEVVVRAPFAARAFRPGQFYRMQNFETRALRAGDTVLGMEGLALTGAWVDREKGLVALIVLEMGGSSNLCSLLKPGEPIILMGPTGTPTEIPSDETVLLAGGGLGNAVLFSIGQAVRKAGSKVLYFAAYKDMNSRYHIENIEAAADKVIWCCDEAPGFEPARPGDASFVGNVVEAMKAYAEGKLGEADIPLSDADRIIAIGSDRMMEAVGQARHAVLEPYLKPGHIGIASINSPMQCMMKEICAQCLQAHKDPVTGEETVVFSCFNQDQPIDYVNFPSLRERLCQNAVQEKLTNQWIARCMESLKDGRDAV